MQTSKQIRIERLQQLVRECGTIEAVARLANTSPQYLRQLRNGDLSASGTPRGIGDALARKLEKSCGKPEGWLDTPVGMGPDASCAIVANPSALPAQVFESRVKLSRATTRLIQAIIAVNEMGRSSPQLIDALTSVLHVAVPNLKRLTLPASNRSNGPDCYAVQANLE